MKTILMTMVVLLAASLSWGEDSRTASDRAPVSGADRPTVRKEQRFNGKVELYITDWCGYCKQAVAYVKSRNIPHVIYDIEKDEAARKRFLRLGGSGVPLIMVGNRRMSGFSPQLLEQYLATAQERSR